eukprot:SAG31_NODE_9945_length_1207_cov_1.052347_2_plen_135_part_00
MNVNGYTPLNVHESSFACLQMLDMLQKTEESQNESSTEDASETPEKLTKFQLLRKLLTSNEKELKHMMVQLASLLGLDDSDDDESDDNDSDEEQDEDEDEGEDEDEDDGIEDLGRLAAWWVKLDATTTAKVAQM